MNLKWNALPSTPTLQCFSNARTTDARHRSCKASVILLCELLHLPSCHLNRRSNEFWMFDERLLRMHCSKDHQAAKATAHPDNISSRVSLWTTLSTSSSHEEREEYFFGLFGKAQVSTVRPWTSSSTTPKSGYLASCKISNRSKIRLSARMRAGYSGISSFTCISSDSKSLAVSTHFFNHLARSFTSSPIGFWNLEIEDYSIFKILKNFRVASFASNRHEFLWCVWTPQACSPGSSAL